MNDEGQVEDSKRDSATDMLNRGREFCERRAWADAYRALLQCDRICTLDAEDLERLSLAAYLIGRDAEYLNSLERGYEAWIRASVRSRAARCAFWLALRWLIKGEEGHANGWLARAERLLDTDQECAERGYLLLITAERCIGTANYENAYCIAERAAQLGERFNEVDLMACARHQQGRALIEQRRVSQGLALLDEAMLAVITGALSPVMTGLVYCSVIETCLKVHALTRSREWTTALAAWCASQPDLVSFVGTCLVHRSEIMCLHGDWQSAIEEAQRVCQRCSEAANRIAVASAFYQQAEVHRLQGRFAAAEEAYRSASQMGREAQPGLALLRLAQDELDRATAGLSRALESATHWLERLKLLPAYTEVLIAAGNVSDARRACSELEELAASLDGDVPVGLAAQARGAVELACGNVSAALGSLNLARQVWQRIEAPYLLARVRVLTALACRAVGDQDGSRMEFEAARSAFKTLGALPDVARIDALIQTELSAKPHGLTARELQVLRAIAEGKTNKSIAAAVSLSEKTVDRHVSNIFSKLGVASRSGATAYAYKNKLI